MIVLNIVLLNLFLALFFESFENPTKETDADDEESSNLLKFQTKIFGYLLRLAKLIPPFIENKLQLTTALKNLESHFNLTEDKTDEEDDEEDLVMYKSLRKLGSVRVFEKEVIADWKRFENDELTD